MVPSRNGYSNQTGENLERDGEIELAGLLLDLIDSCAPVHVNAFINGAIYPSAVSMHNLLKRGTSGTQDEGHLRPTV